VNFGRVYCDFLVYIFLFLNFFETPDDGKSPKVQFVQDGGQFVTIRESYISTDKIHYSTTEADDQSGNGSDFFERFAFRISAGTLTILTNLVVPQRFQTAIGIATYNKTRFLPSQSPKFTLDAKEPLVK
jgi:hypothetical protein